MDLVTDILTIRRFWLAGSFGFAYANLAFIGASLLIQLILVFGQNRNRGFKFLAYEVVIVLIMIKPGK